MRTADERGELVRRRVASLRRERARRRERAVEALCVAGCLALVVALGLWMPGVASYAPSGEVVLGSSDAASLIASGGALGYVLMGVMSFVLGVCVTVLVYRLRRRGERRRRQGDDEL